MVMWQALWSCGRLSGHVAGSVVIWWALWSHGRLSGHVAGSVVMWQALWLYDGLCGHVPSLVVMWQPLWLCGRLCGHVAGLMVMWQVVHTWVHRRKSQDTNSQKDQGRAGERKQDKENLDYSRIIDTGLITLFPVYI